MVNDEPALAPDGSATSWTGIAVDVDNVKRADDALFERERRVFAGEPQQLCDLSRSQNDRCSIRLRTWESIDVWHEAYGVCALLAKAEVTHDSLAEPTDVGGKVFQSATPFVKRAGMQFSLIALNQEGSEGSESTFLGVEASAKCPKMPKIPRDQRVDSGRGYLPHGGACPASRRQCGTVSATPRSASICKRK
jgi:hypothetical protein